MTRIEFTKAIVNLLAAMMLEREYPILDYIKRSDEEQMRLFVKNLSKCDGIKIKSKHQTGRAADIYFIEENKIVDPKKGWEFWHKYWESKGGQPMIEWDRGHFEG
jgi:hypothetical protein